MADQLSIDAATIFDNEDERWVEFDAEVDGERYAFALLYDAIEAMGGAAPTGDAAAIVRREVAPIESFAASALARGADQDRVVISESDLD